MIRDSAGTELAAPLLHLAEPGASGKVSLGTAEIVATAPGLFAANSNGQGVAAAVALRVKANGAKSYDPVARYDETQKAFVCTPIDLGAESDQVFLILCNERRKV